ncbi:MAG: hypothetical protein AAF515_01755 [Pseudomonadota bacterium]
MNRQQLFLHALSGVLTIGLLIAANQALESRVAYANEVAQPDTPVTETTQQ